MTVTNNGCTAICWNMMSGTECDVQCGRDFSTHMPLLTPEPTATLALSKRGFSTTSDDCTTVCWDLRSGSGCDVKCHESGITQIPPSPSGPSSLWRTTFTTGACTMVCQDLILGNECAFQCTGPYSTQTAGKLTQLLGNCLYLTYSLLSSVLDLVIGFVR